MMKYVVLFAVLCGFAAALQMPCNNCKSSKLPTAKALPGATGTCNYVVVEPCSSQPCDLKKGTNVTFQVNFTPNQASSKLTSEVYGIINKIPVKFPLPNPDGCQGSGITCPVAAGQTYTYQDNLFIQNIYPSISVVVQWSLKDENGNPIFCVLVPARIVS
ncbi:NPC intracellular cholesterol transporter 2-like [Paramacrobiotus metropolitanus]|uniref:NPC intracellular cholesterol transporter 2-like n=1 Tax=Paramacrobiotus metropolitanus TaxID=2943436 RepID=UPI0024465A6E|nr:NPC intracellular cholesterol transporter 2-like [Paramacrobiotus metropolitanus]